MSDAELLEQAGAAREAGDYEIMAATLLQLAQSHAAGGRQEEATDFYRGAAEGYAQTGDGASEAACYVALGQLAGDAGDTETAHRQLTRARTIQSARGDLAGLVPTLRALAEVERRLGNAETADQLTGDANRFQTLVDLE
jgi:tetratricopeptide (TPR) repeat protein